MVKRKQNKLTHHSTLWMREELDYFKRNYDFENLEMSLFDIKIYNMEAKLIDKFEKYKGYSSTCFDALDWAEYEAYEVGYMKALFEFGDFSGFEKEVQKFLTNIPDEENNEYFDVNNRKLKEGDIIDIKQTANGNNLFRISSLNPLNIVYHESGRDYEYNQKDLLSPSAANVS